MASRAPVADQSEATQPLLAGATRFVARQPILDLRGRVHGYELLFREGSEAAFHGDCDAATRTMLDNTVIFGLERFTGGLPAFVNCTAESLTENLVQVLPASMTVLEILETVEPTAQLIGALVKLKSAGFRLALDDFVWKPKLAPLVELADYIKVDFVLMDKAERASLLRQLGRVPVALVAEKIETQTEYKRAREEGFTLFQGYYFCRPVLMMNRKVPANQVSFIEILKLLRDETIDLRQLSRLVKQDASLTYRLLRTVNSPVYAVRQEVRSIEAALVIVGEITFRNIAALAIASELNGNQPPEILHMAFVRARFCELAAGLCELDPTEQYLLGMFSLLPAMLQVSMSELAPSLPLRQRIREALGGATSRESSVLQWAERYERGDWVQCDAIALSWGLKQKDLMRCYADAILWAEATMQIAR